MNPEDHVLVPKHEKLSDAEKKKLIDDSSVSLKDLPIILSSDPALSSLKVIRNDIIKIIRNSETSGEIVFFRRVI